MSIFSRKEYYLEVEGFCGICDKDVIFRSKTNWLRDDFLCPICSSIPRERALMQVIKMYYPNYRDLLIHESSPACRGASSKLKHECKSYSSSHYYENVSPGKNHPKEGCRSENLESLTFEDESFDLFITQDVMEHIFHPEKAFREIARVLKPGGAHIFTVPLINKEKTTEVWASLGDDGEITYHHKPEYHGNPIDHKGSLVTMHWGYDLAGFVTSRAATPTTIVMIDNLEAGIRAEYIEVLVSMKVSEYAM